MENLAQAPATEVQRMNRISLKAGIFTGIGLIVYFMVMRMFHLHHIIELHYLNLVFLFFGLRYALKHIITMTSEIKYFEGLKAGIIVTAVSVVVFNIFMLIYETTIDPAFLTFLSTRINLHPISSISETVVDVMSILTIEGLSSGFVVTFILMQYYKSESSETM